MCIVERIAQTEIISKVVVILKRRKCEILNHRIISGIIAVEFVSPVEILQLIKTDRKDQTAPGCRNRECKTKLT